MFHGKQSNTCNIDHIKLSGHCPFASLTDKQESIHLVQITPIYSEKLVDT